MNRTKFRNSAMMILILSLLINLVPFSFASAATAAVQSTQKKLYIFDLYDYMKNDSRFYFDGPDDKTYMTKTATIL